MLERIRKNRRGQVTGQVQKRGSSELEMGATTIISSRSSDSIKLNTKCYMNYSIIFTETSFYPEKLRPVLSERSDLPAELS